MGSPIRSTMIAGMLAGMLGLLLLDPLRGQPVENPEQEIREALAALAALKSLPADRIGAAEIRISVMLAENSPEGIAIYLAASDPWDRRILLRLMGVSGNRDYLGLVHQALGASDSRLHVPSLTAAIAFGDPRSASYLRPFLHAPDVRLVVLAMRYFRAFPQGLEPGDVGRLIGKWDTVHHPAFRRSLLGLLPGFPGRLSQALCGKALEDKVFLLRLDGAVCLAEMGMPEGTTALKRLFREAEDTQQLKIVEMLKILDPKGGIPLFLEWLRHDNATVRYAALMALQELEAKEAVPVLMELIDSGADGIPRPVLIKSLGLFGDAGSLPFLGAGLEKAEGAAEKGMWIEALGDLGRIEGQRYLSGHLSSYHPELREAARKAVRKIAIRQMEAGKQ